MRETHHEFIESQYYLPTEFDKMGGVWPLKVGYNISKPNYHMGPRIIEYFSIHFVTQGRVLYTYKNQKSVLREGDVFCLYPDTNHEYQTLCLEQDPPLKMHWLAFGGPQSHSLMDMIGFSSSTPFLRSKVNHDVAATLNRILEIMKMKNSIEQERLLLSSLFFQVLFQLTEDGTGRLETASNNVWIEKSVDFMNTYFTENITVEEVASHVGLHRSYFSRMFASTIGKSPKAYLQMKRMEKSVIMLKENKYSITEIALTLGYPNLYSFTRAFKNYYGVSPKNYTS